MYRRIYGSAGLHHLDALWPGQPATGQGHDNVEEDKQTQAHSHSHLHVPPPTTNITDLRNIILRTQKRCKHSRVCSVCAVVMLAVAFVDIQVYVIGSVSVDVRCRWCAVPAVVMGRLINAPAAVVTVAVLESYHPGYYFDSNVAVIMTLVLLWQQQ